MYICLCVSSNIMNCSGILLIIKGKVPTEKVCYEREKLKDNRKQNIYPKTDVARVSLTKTLQKKLFSVH